jgi:hypothetical protein
MIKITGRDKPCPYNLHVHAIFIYELHPTVEILGT